jgi:hypothetical protein
MPAPSQSLVIVLGAHRSGSSLATRALEVLGVNLGDNPMPADRFNQTGYSEDMDFFHLNEEIMESTGRDWHYLKPIEEDELVELCKGEYFSRARDLLAAKMGSSGPYGVKDPRFSILLPFWMRVFEANSLEPTYVISLRDPRSVASSLARRDGLPEEKSHWMWISHYLGALSGSAGFRRVVVDYGEMLRSPLRQVERMSKALCLEINRDRMVVFEGTVVNSGANDSRARAEGMTATETCPDLAHDIYQKLYAAARDETPIDTSEWLGAWLKAFDSFKSLLNLSQENDRLLKQRAQLIHQQHQSICDLQQAIQSLERQSAKSKHEPDTAPASCSCLNSVMQATNASSKEFASPACPSVKKALLTMASTAKRKAMEHVRRFLISARIALLHRNSGIFDPIWYLQQNADVKAATARPFVHFLRHGVFEGRAPHGKFDAQSYIEQRKDVASSEIIPAVHYMLWGYAEKIAGVAVQHPRKPSTYDAELIHLMTNRIYNLPDVRVDGNRRKTINVLVPAFDFKTMSAGFFGVFQVARFLRVTEWNVRLVLFDNFAFSMEGFKRRFLEYPGMENLLDELEVEYIGERKHPLHVSPDDVCMATVWYSAHFAKKISASLGERPFLYLIQDYETNFFPGGSLATLAEESYKADYVGLFSTESLRRFFIHNNIGGFVTRELRGISFENSCSSSLPSLGEFLASHRSKPKKKIGFYSRPMVDRNMFHLAALSLITAFQEGIFNPNEWECVGLGLGEARLELLKGVFSTQHPRLTLKEYEQTVGEFDICLTLMASPHPSLIPMDFAGSGVIVVTNTFQTKTDEYLTRVSKNIVPVTPSLPAILEGLKAARERCSDLETRHFNAEHMNHPRTWESSLTSVHASFINEHLLNPILNRSSL